MTKTQTQTASERITEEVTSWPGVEAGPDSRGQFAFRVGRREIGHLHGDHAAHFSFPKDVGLALREQGRVVDHPVFPGRPGPAARAIEDEADVRDVIDLLRLNYDRTVARHGVPARSARMTADPTSMETGIAGLYASAPEQLPFAPALDIRAFLLRRDRGNILIYSTTGLGSAAAAIEGLGGISRHYLNHWHESLFASEWIDAPLFVHESDRDAVAEPYRVRASFSTHHVLDDDFDVIPTPGHTAGAASYLWESGNHRLLFTGDTIEFQEGEWVAGLLESSDRDSYIESLELIRELDFDILVPWATTRGGPYYAATDKADRERRIGAIIDRLRRGEDR
jgi:glyoxylase-like metal-dependent hydrolase (beta-lactamase superfamily II)